MKKAVFVLALALVASSVFALTFSVGLGQAGSQTALLTEFSFGVADITLGGGFPITRAFLDPDHNVYIPESPKNLMTLRQIAKRPYAGIELMIPVIRTGTKDVQTSVSIGVTADAVLALEGIRSSIKNLKGVVSYGLAGRVGIDVGHLGVTFMMTLPASTLIEAVGIETLKNYEYLEFGPADAPQEIFEELKAFSDSCLVKASVRYRF